MTCNARDPQIDVKRGIYSEDRPKVESVSRKLPGSRVLDRSTWLIEDVFGLSLASHPMASDTDEESRRHANYYHWNNDSALPHYGEQPHFAPKIWCAPSVSMLSGAPWG
jgi:hypothetical protein